MPKQKKAQTGGCNGDKACGPCNQKGEGPKIDKFLAVAKKVGKHGLKIGDTIFKNRKALLAAIEAGATIASLINPESEAAQKTANIANILGGLGQSGAGYHKSSYIYVPNTGEVKAPTSVYQYDSLSAAPWTGRLVF